MDKDEKGELRFPFFMGAYCAQAFFSALVTLGGSETQIIFRIIVHMVVEGKNR